MKLLKIFFILLISVSHIFSQKSEMKTTTTFGYIQPAYGVELTNSNIPNNEFFIKRFRLGLESHLYDRINAEIEIDPLQKNIVKDAKIDFQPANFVSITLGRQKMPFSRERLVSHKNLQFVDRTKVVREFDDEGYAGRDIGVILKLDKKFKNTKINLFTGVFNGNKGDMSGDFNNSKTYVQRIEINSKSFSVGFNSAQKYDSLSSKYFVANGFDFVVYPYKNFSITSEFLLGRKNSNTLFGGEYISIEYILKKFVFGVRFSQYFSDINKPGKNYYEAKIDYLPFNNVRLYFNWINEKERNQKLISNLIIGAAYVF